MVAPIIQGGVVRAPGISTHAKLTWPGLKDIELVSLYLETGGQLTECNLKLLADVAAFLHQDGNPYWMSGDFQMDWSKLEEAGWWTAINGTVRTGNPKLGTCTASTPPSNIDYMVFHKDLDMVASAATVDMDADLSPRRPVWATLP